MTFNNDLTKLIQYGQIYHSVTIILRMDRISKEINLLIIYIFFLFYFNSERMPSVRRWRRICIIEVTHDISQSVETPKLRAWSRRNCLGENLKRWLFPSSQHVAGRRFPIAQRNLKPLSAGEGGESSEENGEKKGWFLFHNGTETTSSCNVIWEES